MHKGRPYPYHPFYWSTEAWFYRGFVPWKLVGEDLAGTWGYPFDHFHFANGGEVSAEGIADPDYKVITYTFVQEGNPATLRVLLDKFMDGATPKARWRTAIAWDGITRGTAYLLQTYPQRVVLGEGCDMVICPPPSAAEGKPNYRFSPATYSQGGSPYDRPWPFPY